ncbi:FAD/FMN-containing dehydrogenase [Parasphingorhabdus marina DSM 22363]|uniref:D-lactate dehydrogenase (cytochrome) n=1 Tax=Parasphingorhabdus marina DSM 22363 TaxID=1123272 RepID=A0A1N6D002_9SPHN|nr:FAD-binding oxidoreductase [Parasphingorhabdus marina]SIN64036.1 FAD/FMN-containing dehydrogenase [Parasphingorhabdus marina DSM 22363]
MELETETANTDDGSLVKRLAMICGSDGVSTTPADLRYFSQDLFFDGDLPLAVVSPGGTDAVVEIIHLCRASGIAIFLRGGGMSYTKAFQPEGNRSIMLDFSRLNKIRDIAVDDGHVTVEAGCTWAALDAALAKHDRRARFWGPMSGGTATVGGSLSQGTVTFGSGTTGASANAVKSFEIVSGTGEIIHSGSDGSAGLTPFNRNFGPDMTGLFANDAGALGIKTAATMEIEPRPAMVSGLSFAYDDFDTMAKLFADLSARRLASEMIAMDGDVARQNAGPANLVEDAKAMWRIGKAAGNPVSAVERMIRIAMAGRRFLDKAKYTAHFVVEGRDRAELKSRIDAIRGFAGTGSEIVNTVPLMTRADPFPSLPVTHPDGRRMLPVHTVLPHSALHQFHRDYCDLKSRFANRMQQVNVTIAEFFAGVSGIGLLYEPVFYWPDALQEYHHRMTPDYLEGQMPEYPENAAARKLVEEIVADFVALAHDHGGSHFQIGRLYPFAENREQGAGDLLRDLKKRLDPDNIINPGALGL